VIYGIRGALDLELSDRTDVVEAGACCVIDAGTPHRAYTAGTAPVVLLHAQRLEPSA
jgi:mannose-6-phosphate isomerase-like protein (cupin superfamily)